MRLYLVNRKSQEGQTRELKKSFDEITEKFARLSIEHQAMKIEKSEIERRLSMLEEKDDEAEFREHILST